MSWVGRLLLALLILAGNAGLIVSLVVRRERLSRRAVWLVVYLAQSALGTLGLAAGLAAPASRGLWVLSAASTALLLLALVSLAAATLSLVESKQRAWWWLLLPAAFVLATLALDARLVGPRPLDVMAVGLRITQEGLRLACVILTWGAAFVLSVMLTGRVRTRSSSPLHRNRLRYWIIGLALASVGTAVTLAALVLSPDVALMGGVLALLGSLVLAMTWQVFYPPDLRVIARRVAGAAIITLATFAVYLLGIRVAQSAFGLEAEWGPVAGAVLVASVLAVGYGPLRQGVQRLVERALGGVAADYAASLQDYTRRITQILDLDTLVSVAVETADAALDIPRGAVLLAQENADGSVALQAIGGTGIAATEELVCPLGSPIGRRWRVEGAPLLQYDADVLPDFRAATAAERAQLASWRMEIYLPIRVMEHLIGVLALGSKRSGDPYFESDIAFLAALADATGVALQHARLFSELRVANQQLSTLNQDLGQANAQLKELDKLKSGFIGVITHELRSPFAALNFSLQLIQRYGLDNLLPDQRDQLGQLTEGLKRAETMINNLVTFAAFVGKQGQLNLARVDLRQVAEETARTLEPIALKREVSLTVSVESDLPLVDGDRERLSDALYHLVQNAIKFNRPGGQVKVMCQLAPEHVVVEVSDTGLGIPEDKLATMWEDFTQSADPLRRGVEGLGLGLPLVKYVVTAHGGKTWANSEEGLGSTFGFSIPIKGAQHEPQRLTEPHRDGRLGALVSKS